MRLTLRTLLAYRDRVLNPIDQEDLHRRIQQSETATNVLRRIDRVAGEVEGASVIVGKGMAADPNTIAAYLDDTLPQHLVPEFERVVLQSDHYLGEVAQCHRILATAVNKHVEMPTELKSLAYRIGDPKQREEVRQQWLEHKQAWRQLADQHVLIQRVDAAHRAAVPAPKFAQQKSPADASRAADSDSAAADGTKAQPPIEQLPGGSSPREERLVDAELVGGETRRVDQAHQGVHRERVLVASPMMESAGQSIRQGGLDLESETAIREVPEYLRRERHRGWQLPAVIAVLTFVFLLLVWQAVGPWERIRPWLSLSPQLSQADSASERGEVNPGDRSAVTDPSTKQPGAVAGQDAGTAQAATSPGAGREHSSPPEDTIEQSVEAPPGVAPDTPEAEAAIDTVAAGENSPPVPGGSGQGELLAAETVTASSDDGTPATADTSAQQLEGNRITWAPLSPLRQRALVFARSSADEAWRIVDRDEPLGAGSEVGIPPNYRTDLAFPGGIRWEVAGATWMQVEQSTEIPRVQVRLARALLSTTLPTASLELVTATAVGRIELLTPDSVASVDVGHRRVRPGDLLDETVFPQTTVIIAAHGSIRYVPQPADGSEATPIELPIGEGVALIGRDRPRRFKLMRVPSWFRVDAVRPIDRLGAEELVQQVRGLPPDTDLLAFLRQLSGDPRPETAAAAIRASLLLGDFAPLVRVMLNDARFAPHWYSTLDLAVEMLAQRPERLAEFEALLTEQFGAKGAVIVNALLSRPAESMVETLSHWVGLLDDDSLPVRVAVGYTLQRWTGKDLGYLPQTPNRAAVQNWRRQATSGRLLPEQIDPVWERN